MKLTAPIYQSPNEKEGTFKDVFFEDVSYTRNRIDKTLIIVFEMYYFKNEKRIVLSRLEQSFIGNEGDEVSTNQTLFVEIDNPDYDAQNPDSSLKVTIPLFGPDGNYNFNPETTPFTVVDFGYPTCEKVLQYFEGGTLENPEIIINNPLAMEFVLNKFSVKNEALGVQFQFV